MPPHCKNPNKPAPDDPGWLHYVEPYFGGGSVLLANDPEGISEVVNDIDGELTNFWDTLKSPERFLEFQRTIQATPFSQVEFERAMECDSSHSPLDRAVSFLVRSRQSRQGLGDGFATLSRNRTRRGMSEQSSAWLTGVDGLADVAQRMLRVLILNDHAPRVIIQQDGKRTLYYLDPPYIHDSRETKDAYEHEMSESEHRELLLTLVEIEGRFMLSGYHGELYDEFSKLNGWRCEEIKIDNKAGSGGTKREMTECLWMNY